MKLKCPNCSGEILIPTESQVGSIVTCPDCRFSWEIIKIEKNDVQVVKAESSSFDWGQ